MTTAREQARKAGRKTLETVHTLSHGRNGEIAADAASDVWEPLLAEAVEVINGLVDQQAMPDRFYEGALARAKEALG